MTLHRSGLQIRLGGDAAAVQARAPERATLDDGDLETRRGGVERRPIAAGSPADHHEIELLFHRWLLQS